MGTIPVNSLGRHIEPLRESLAAVASKVIGSGYYVLGPHVAAFEKAFADYCGIEHCIGLANGTDALELSLKALGIGEGDEVAVCANAAMYGTSAVLACGAAAVFIDTLENGTMDPSALEQAMRHARIRAVIVTHLFGQLADIETIVRLCTANDVRVVEDCAQAHGARDGRGRMAGSFGDISSFSFYPTKNLGALGDGGAVTTGDALLATRMRQLRQYGWTQKYTNGLSGGRNSRLDELQAAMLLPMLSRLDAWNERRRYIANRYSASISHPAIMVPAQGGMDYVAHLYVVRCDNRDGLREHLARHEVQTEIHYPVPDHLQPCHQGRYSGVSLPVTERDCARVLTLPCFPELEDHEVEAVVEACNLF